MLSDETTPPGRSPVIIVGGGLAALLLAERLARQRTPVVVADKNASFGGCNGRTSSGVPLVCYKALGFEPGSALARLVESPEVWPNAPPRRMAAIDNVYFPGESIVLPGSLDAFRAVLVDRYPGERPAIDRLCDAMRRVYGAIRDSSGLARPVARIAAMQVLREFAQQRWADWLRLHVTDPGLRRVLAVRAFCSSNSALTMLAYLGKMLIDGLYELPESGASLCDALARRLRASPDCRLLPGTWVDEIVFDADARACGVRLRSGELIHGSVVLNVDPERVATRMVREVSIAADLRRATAAQGVSLSALNFVFNLTPDLGRALASRRDTARFFHSDAVDPFDVLSAREAGRFDLRNCKINLDFGADGTALRAYVELDCSARATPPGDDLVALASSLLHRRLRSLHPDFADGVDAVEFVTPHDFAERTDHRGGASSGFAEAAAAGPRPLDRVLAAHGLHQVGQWSAHGSGLSQLDASAAGVYAALRRAQPALASAN